MVALTNQESNVSTSTREESAYGDYKRTETEPKQAEGETLHRFKSTNPDKGKMNMFLIVRNLYML